MQQFPLIAYPGDPMDVRGGISGFVAPDEPGLQRLEAIREMPGWMRSQLGVPIRRTTALKMTLEVVIGSRERPSEASH